MAFFDDILEKITGNSEHEGLLQKLKDFHLDGKLGDVLKNAEEAFQQHPKEEGSEGANPLTHLVDALQNQKETLPTEVKEHVDQLLGGLKKDQ